MSSRNRQPRSDGGLRPCLRFVLVAVALASCADAPYQGVPLGQDSFAEYRRDAMAWLEGHRDFQSGDRRAETAWNAPQEWRPEGAPERGILLIHGLGDSPWSFHDLGPRLASQGFLARSVLLPGHGTRPEDLLDVSLDDWRRLVDEQAAILRREVGQVYLGGFSTGANLALDFAYEHPEVAGLVLFSPAFRTDSAYDWLAPLFAWARPWVMSPEGPRQNAVRYMKVPTNGFAQLYHSSVAVRRHLDQRPYDKPVLMVVAEHDSVLDTSYLLNGFRTRFRHPASRLVWYGALPNGAQGDARILARPDLIPEYRISQFSHMAPLFSPDNPLYGVNGTLRICWNGPDPVTAAACEEAALVWLSDWGYREEGKVHARLTYNPYFEWQAQVMAEVLAAAANLERPVIGLTHDESPLTPTLSPPTRGEGDRFSVPLTPS